MPSVRYFSNSIGNFDERERDREGGGGIGLLTTQNYPFYRPTLLSKKLNTSQFFQQIKPGVESCTHANSFPPNQPKNRIYGVKK